MKTRLSAATALGVLAVISVPLRAQPPLFTTAMPKEEFAARRARVMEQIGDGIVVMQGATETAAYEKFRQSVQFYYLTGIETPRAFIASAMRARDSGDILESAACSGAATSWPSASSTDVLSSQSPGFVGGTGNGPAAATASS